MKDERKPVKFMDDNCHNGRNYFGDKVLDDCIILLVPNDNEPDDYTFAKSLAKVHIYRGRSAGASKVYVTIWVNDIDFYCSGSGWAGGGGYHKPSTAMQIAMADAGIKADRLIEARGRDAMDEVLADIAYAKGYRQWKIISA